MVAMLWDDFRKVFAATFTFSFVPVVSIFAIHKVLKIRFPALTLCIGRQSKVLWAVNGGTVARQRLMLVSVIHISSSPIFRVWSHFLVKWFAFIFAVRNESHSNTEPFSVNFYSESFTVVIWHGFVYRATAWYTTVQYRLSWTQRRYAKSRNTEINSKCGIYKCVVLARVRA